MKKRKVLSFIVIVCFISILAISLLGCEPWMSGYETFNYTAETTVMNDDGYIFSAGENGLIIYKTDNGAVSVVKKDEILKCRPRSLMLSGNYLIMVRYKLYIKDFDENEIEARFYDLSELAEANEEIAPTRKTVFTGNLISTKIISGDFYIVNLFDRIMFKKISYRDDIEGKVGVTAKTTLKVPDTSYGFGISKLSLNSLSGSYETHAYEGTIEQFEFLEKAIYTVSADLSIGGCGCSASGETVSYITKLSYENFGVVKQSSKISGIFVANSLYEYNNNLFAYVYSDKMSMSISNLDNIDYKDSEKIIAFDGNLNEKSSVKLASDSANRYNRSAFAVMTDQYYYVYAYGKLYKINISNPSKLVASAEYASSYINSLTFYGSNYLLADDGSKFLLLDISGVGISLVDTLSFSGYYSGSVKFLSQDIFCFNGTNDISVFEIQNNKIIKSGQIADQSVQSRIFLKNGYIYIVSNLKVLSYDAHDFTLICTLDLNPPPIIEEDE